MDHSQPTGVLLAKARERFYESTQGIYTGFVGAGVNIGLVCCDLEIGRSVCPHNAAAYVPCILLTTVCDKVFKVLGFLT